MSRRIFTSASGEAYSYETFDRDLSQYELKHLGEIAVWWEYRRLKRFPGPNQALQELFVRHEGMLRQLALQSHSLHSGLSEFDDKLQHARCGAITAYERFDLDKAQDAGGRLSTFVRTTVFRHLQSANDEDAFVVCPPTRRSLRNYLNGRYDGDPVKKRSVEEKLGIRCADDIHNLRKDFGLLNARFYSYDYPVVNVHKNHVDFEELVAGLNITESNIIDKIQIESSISMMSPRQQEVFSRYNSDESVESIAQSMGLSQSAIRNDIKAVRESIEKSFSADNIPHV